MVYITHHNHYHITYADTVLPLKEKGENIHVASINELEDYNLDDCVEIIAKANPNVIINTIQYSKNKKTVYFYSDKPLSVGAWKESRIFKYEGVSGIDKIIESLDVVLNKDVNLNTGYISAYDLSNIIESMITKVENEEKYYASLLRNRLNSDIGLDCRSILYSFDYETQTIKMGFKRYSTSEWGDISFIKDGKDLRIKEATSVYAKEVFASASDVLLAYYDYCMKNKLFKTKYNFGIRSADGLMRVSVSKHGVTIRDNDFIHSKLEIDRSSSNGKYSVSCNSSSILEKIRGKNDNLFKNVYVRIEDCPQWCKEEALDFRINQVKEEIKKIRRKDFLSRLNPFSKIKRSK